MCSGAGNTRWTKRRVIVGLLFTCWTRNQDVHGRRQSVQKNASMQGFPIRASQSVPAGNRTRQAYAPRIRITILLLALANHASFRPNCPAWKQTMLTGAITTLPKKNCSNLCTSFQLLGQNWDMMMNGFITAAVKRQ